ncbi:MAG: TraR/DksA C4-type zinc finger protein [Cytophagales bacterium]|nr:TraR/DksA C4-type zinc finger protein [Cytophagales bacterium]MDW8385339.1 TraR/DksA C4-type zinc finger protein [Flammeovirgaceae bacterium]
MNTISSNNTTKQLRYSREELNEFEAIIKDKLAKAKAELAQLKDAIIKTSMETGNHDGNFSTMEDGASSFEKEYLNQMAARTQKYVTQLEHALIRIKNGTYGICVDTGKLISKERLRVVPHTMHSIEAKRERMA